MKSRPVPVLNSAVLDAPSRLRGVAQVRHVLPRSAVRWDAVARMAARMARAPTALVTLVDEGEDHFVGAFGLPEPFASERRGPRDCSVCAYVVSSGRTIAVGDMTAHPHLAAHPLVAGHHVRAFAGTPLRDSHGRCVGAVTVIDTVSRSWSRTQLSALREIADMLGPDPVALTGDVSPRRRGEAMHDCQKAVAQALQRSNTLADAAPGVLSIIGQSLGVTVASLWLGDQVTDVLRPASTWHAPHLAGFDQFSDAVSAGNGPVGYAWQTGRPLWLSTDRPAVRDDVPGMAAFAEACVRHGVRTAMVVPVLDGVTTVGVLCCLSQAPEQDEFLLLSSLEATAAQLGQFIAGRRSVDLAAQLARSQADFVALVGHELRTPVTAVAGAIELLRAEITDGEGARVLDVIARNAATLRMIIDKLLDLASLESGNVEVSFAEVDVAAVVRDALGAVELGDDMRVRINLPPRLVVEADHRRLRQAIDHLLSNAVKYSPHGGDISIHLRTAGDVMELSVSDSGIGIPAGDRPRLFQRFSRAINARRSRIAGTGLGLVFVRVIVEAHHGTVTFDSARRRGTRITVRLPRRQRTR